MTTAASAWLGAAALFAVSDWLAVARGWKLLEYICKPATLVALVALAGALNPTVPGRRGWFAAALLLSLAGDVFLMWPKDLFLPGLASFLLAHLAYVGGLTRDGGAVGAAAVSVVPVVVVAGAVGTRVLRAARGTGLEGPMAVYMVAIGAMVTTALATGNALLATGAVLFLVSDSLIAWNRFVGALRWGPLAIIVTYHLAQIGLVTGMST